MGKLLLSLDDCDERRRELQAESEAAIAVMSKDDTPDDEAAKLEARCEEIATELKGITKREAVLRELSANKQVNEATGKRLTAPATQIKVDDPDDSHPADDSGLPKESLRPFGSLRSFKDRGTAYACGQWLRAVRGDTGAARWLQDYGHKWGIDYGAVMQTGSNTAGGYLVPDPLAASIIDLRDMHGVARREMRFWAMTSDTLSIPKHNTSVTAYYVGETDQITASDQAFGQVQLTAKKVGTITRISSDLSEDAIVSVADWLAFDIAWRFSQVEDDAAWNGDGTSTYGGIYGVENKVDDGNHTASVSTAASGNTAFSTLDASDFTNCAALLPAYARPNAKWYISPAGFSASMERLALAAGGNTTDNYAAGAQARFLGYPVVLVPSAFSTLTASVDEIVAIFGDLRLGAAFGGRRDVRVKVDDSRYLEFDQTAIQATERFDVIWHSLGDTSTAGPIVALNTPGS